jgi:hypothetical protein
LYACCRDGFINLKPDLEALCLKYSPQENQSVEKDPNCHLRSCLGPCEKILYPCNYVLYCLDRTIVKVYKEIYRVSRDFEYKASRTRFKPIISLISSVYVLHF